MIERETHEFNVDTDFTVSLLTVVSGRYDNESPPLFNIYINITTRLKERKYFSITLY